ncbi:unnamed protein product, partial [Discosporangium mesarthrocarpum]
MCARATVSKQKQNRYCPGWEMPLPAASVSRDETQELDREASALVDDLEMSLPEANRRASIGRAGAAGAGVEGARAGVGVGGGEAPEQGDGAGEFALGRSRHASPGHQGGDMGGLVEPSLLAAGFAGLGASAPPGRLLPLWDYLLVRRDKYFGFFLLLAALTRRKDELLASSGERLRILLEQILSAREHGYEAAVVATRPRAAQMADG